MGNPDDAALRRIVQQILGPVPALYVPTLPEKVPLKVGARFIVAPSRRELPGGMVSAAEFFEALQRVPMPHGVIGTSAVNLVVSRISHLDPLHKQLHAYFLTRDRIDQLLDFVRNNPPVPDAVHVFNRVGILLLQRLVLLISSQADGKDDEPNHLLGELALMANDYVTGSALRAHSKDDVDYVTLLVELLPTWDLTNGPDLAYGLTRAYRMLRVHLLGDDPTVIDLREKVPLDFSKATFDGLRVDEYVGCIFGLYSWYQTLDNTKTLSGAQSCVIDTARFLSATHFAQESLDRFLTARSKTITEFRGLISTSPVDSATALDQVLTSDVFVADTMPFRTYPLCKIDENKVVCLDARFLSELLITGLYWRVLESLSSAAHRDVFMSLWGRLFELYLAELFRFHYPSSLSPLRIDVAYQGGQVDALLDFGDDVVLFEFKGSLLKAAAKYNRDPTAFREDFALKFVENEKGAPKAVRQLAASVTAALDGRLQLSTTPRRIFPVLVGYESTLDAFWMNRYADDLFHKMVDVAHKAIVRPLTLLSAESFETSLSHTAAGDISWPDLLSRRFVDDKVVDYSVAQAIYDWREETATERRRNDFILAEFKGLFDRGLASYKE